MPERNAGPVRSALPYPAVFIVAGALTGCTPAAPADSSAGDAPLARTEIITDAALAASIDDFLRPLVAAERLSGVVLVGDREEVLYARAFGEADRESGAPVTLDSRFRIASITKTLTSAAILRLRNAGALALNDSLARWAPEYPRGDDITIRHLLLHTSGLDNPDYEASFHESIGLDELASRIAAKPLLFEPGSQNRYSNAGYNTLALVIERETGGYERFLKREIFDPLGMAHTGHPASEADVVTGHMPAPSGRAPWPVPESDVTGFSFGSGSLASTAEDLWRWGAAMADERIVTWQELEWPYGWGRAEIGDHTGIEQTGATAGYMSSLFVLPGADRIVVTLHNVEIGGWVQIAEGIAALAVGAAPPNPEVTRVQEAVALARAPAAYTGSYRSEQGTTFHIRETDGDLRMFWESWPLGKFLEPVGDDRFVPLGDGGSVEFLIDDGAPAARAFQWVFGDGPGTTYTRLES